MPALGEAKDADGNPLLSDQDLWSIVHYVGWLSEQGPEAGAHRGADGDHGGHGGHAATSAEHAGSGAGNHLDRDEGHDEETH
jgi:hypothetical protein